MSWKRSKYDHKINKQIEQQRNIEGLEENVKEFEEVFAVLCSKDKDYTLNFKKNMEENNPRMNAVK